MNCKNCQNPLKENAHFCENCGAKVVIDKITFKNLFLDFFINVFGFDSKFFLTIRTIFITPEKILKEYLDGVRKRYMNPFAFLAVSAGISLLVFNYFADDFIAINKSVSVNQFYQLEKDAKIDTSKMIDLSEKQKNKLERRKKTAEMQLKFNSGIMQFMLRYLNLLTFVFLFILAVLSKWTFWKPYNYGEHLVINAYIYGFANYLTLILFFLAIAFHPSIYYYSTLLYIIFYIYAFGRFFKVTIWKNFLRTLKFIFGLAIVCLILFIIATIIVMILTTIGILDFSV
ncbi:hypothetical protein BW723_00970 [Polaribacter reichenbachii]|uniref:Zinc-ribbon domain-containing protein n=1 Tax=Polaribacter reichenbachii TaxID=996801 RepID=A0A1B8TRY0_9FLAO|nr:DUF3667 domain-containing protein [Polaribacter reichenbachii]APZ44944.1 hypothetical protein BW723_00970 [Polaribacter reichenbachii]AUC18807.1 hypothetical protein BTO17_08975 [Polaribacter reichenbachii]OBY62362.1 hypothetical protein LPB301_14720 [Polaribacter reichenbachii]